MTNNMSKKMTNKITKKCKKPTITNYCQDKSSGGHQGTIFSINKKTCIKQITKINNEIIFYNKHKELLDKGINVLKDYIPKYNSMCILNNKTYFEMENLKGSFKQPLSIDIKLGYKSVSKKIIKIKKKTNLFKIYSKLTKHYILDSIITPSNKYGFRIEGVSLPSNVKLNKLTIMKSNFSKIFDYYFINDKNNHSLNYFIKKLKDLSNSIVHYDFNRYYFVGASILFTYDGLDTSINPSMKLIDFENSIILDNDNAIQKNIKHANKIRKSIKTLILVLNDYLKTKINTIKN